MYRIYKTGWFIFMVDKQNKAHNTNITQYQNWIWVIHWSWGPIVVHPTAIIGNNCNLSQFTTIGSNENHAARIGDNTYIGPNVCIVENVSIGSNVTIGAGSIVTKDIPDNATAVGNYAKVIITILGDM